MMLEPDAFATKWGSLTAVVFSALQAALTTLGHELEVLHIPMYMGLTVGATGLYFQRKRDAREKRKERREQQRALDEHEAHKNEQRRKDELHAIAIRQVQEQGQGE